MNRRCLIFVGLLLALLPNLVAADADTPAVAVVRQFLAARFTGHYAEAYALLSAASRQQYSEQDFAAGTPAPSYDAGEMPAPLFFLAALFVDTHNTRNYSFVLVSPAPDNSSVVLVDAVPPAGSVNSPSVILRLLTVKDPGVLAPRIDVFGSMAHTSPIEIAEAREIGQKIVSQSNLKQLSLGIIQYMQDHDERYPDANHWVDEIMPFVHNAALFHDPAAPAGEKWSYAFNRNLSHISAAKIDSPATLVMLFESSKGVKNASDTGQSVPHPGRHEGGTDYAFADGHVKWFRSQSPPPLFGPLNAVPRDEITIYGRVYHSMTLKPVSGTFVIFSQSPKSVTPGSVRSSSFTDKTGRFQSVLYPGKNYLMVLKDGRFKPFGSVTRYKAIGRASTVSTADDTINMVLPGGLKVQASSALDKATGVFVITVGPGVR